MEATAEQLTLLAAQVGAALRRRQETVATAESLSGGMVGALLTATAGASDYYRGGVVVYATDLKERLTGVPAGLLAERGAVDPDVAIAMATGVRERLVATWGLALTGVAGPDPQDGKPVGTLYVGIAGPDGSSVVSHQLSGDREAVRMASCSEALHALYMRLGNGE